MAPCVMDVMDYYSSDTLMNCHWPFTIDEQIAKIEAKAERDAERAAKLAEKEERELALKLAMKAEADKMLVVEEAMGISESWHLMQQLSL